MDLVAIFAFAVGRFGELTKKKEHLRYFYVTAMVSYLVYAVLIGAYDMLPIQIIGLTSMTAAILIKCNCKS
jgi:uncharacterized membrane protein (DUF485 family)